MQKCLRLIWSNTRSRHLCLTDQMWTLQLWTVRCLMALVVTCWCLLPTPPGFDDFHLSIHSDMATVAKAMASPESGLEVRDRMWLKITIANAFIGTLSVIYHHITHDPAFIIMFSSSVCILLPCCLVVMVTFVFSVWNQIMPGQIHLKESHYDQNHLGNLNACLVCVLDS